MPTLNVFGCPSSREHHEGLCHVAASHEAFGTSDSEKHGPKMVRSILAPTASPSVPYGAGVSFPFSSKIPFPSSRTAELCPGIPTQPVSIRGGDYNNFSTE